MNKVSRNIITISMILLSVILVISAYTYTPLESLNNKDYDYGANLNKLEETPLYITLSYVSASAIFGGSTVYYFMSKRNNKSFHETFSNGNKALLFTIIVLISTIILTTQQKE